MKKQISVFFGVDEFQLTQNFDSDNNSDNLDVSFMGDHIGEIKDEIIPEIDGDDDEMNIFEERIKMWLKDNYYN